MDDCALVESVITEICLKMRLLERMKDDGVFERVVICPGCGKVMPRSSLSREGICVVCDCKVSRIRVPEDIGIRANWLAEEA